MPAETCMYLQPDSKHRALSLDLFPGGMFGHWCCWWCRRQRPATVGLTWLACGDRSCIRRIGSKYVGPGFRTAIVAIGGA